MDWIGHSFAAAPQLSPQGRRGDYRGSRQSIHYVVAASQGRRAPRVTRRPRLLVRLRSTPCGGPQSVRNPPISTTYGEEVPRHREDDRRRCPEAAPSGSSAKCCQKAASGVTLLEGVTTWQRTAVSGGSPTSWVTPRAPPLAVFLGDTNGGLTQGGLTTTSNFDPKKKLFFIRITSPIRPPFYTRGTAHLRRIT